MSTQEELGRIKNFGPYMVKILNRIGIHTRTQLEESDYRLIRRRLLEAGIQPHLLIFYSIEMGLQDRHWNDITSQEKEELKKLLQ